MKAAIKIMSFLIVMLFCGNTYANNLQITNLQIDPSGNSASFDISWENSWYFSSAPDNWDAAWVFMKSSDCSDPFNIGDWLHIDLSSNNNDFSVTGGVLQVDAVADGKGIFIRRANPGVGNIAMATVTVTFANTPAFNLSSTNFKIFGTEMVSVLQGDFETGGYFGTEGSSTDMAAHHTFNRTTITSEAAIPAGTLTAPQSATTSWRQYHPTIGANFPKGWNQFYIMKYEITQEQYVAFLNTLTYAQQSARTNGTNTINYNALYLSANTNIYNRNGIKVKTPGTSPITPREYDCDLNNNNVYGEAYDGRNLACNNLTWYDLLAYLDWAALRPMTELEFEKASRGPIQTMPNEYAWGNDQIVQARSDQLINVGEGSEISNASIVPGSGIAATGYTSGGPLRVGFPAMSNTDRLEAGASYWGVMELSGNVFEQCFSVGNRNAYQNTNFDGTLGDGNLASNGNADVANWDPSSYTSSILRGGSFYRSTTYARVGSRYYAYYTTNILYNNSRNSSYPDNGGRGVRQF